MSSIKVAVWMITYNHASYISEAIDSVIRQKCNFNIHIFIGVDYSSDNTLEIVLDYQHRFPETITILPSAHRLGPSHNAMRVYKACIDSGAEYMALLEGDDYWIEENKLQRQVEIMDLNPDVTVVGTSYLIDRDGQRLNCRLDCDGEELMPGYFSFDNKMNMTNWYTKTCTSVLRISAISLATLSQYKNIFDYHVMYEVLHNGRGIYINKPTAYYRIHESGIWAQKSAAEKSRVTYLLHGELLALHPQDSFLREQFIHKTNDFIEWYSNRNVSFSPLVLIAPVKYFILTKDIRKTMRFYKKIILRLSNYLWL